MVNEMQINFKIENSTLLINFRMGDEFFSRFKNKIRVNRGHLNLSLSSDSDDKGDIKKIFSHLESNFGRDPLSPDPSGSPGRRNAVPNDDSPQPKPFFPQSPFHRQKTQHKASEKSDQKFPRLPKLARNNQNSEANLQDKSSKLESKSVSHLPSIRKS
jgi:hypothetical protein